MSAEDGLAFAIAFMDFTSDEEFDPSYGEIIFNITEWGVGEDGAFY